jgi:hypothetical protein
MLSVENIFFVPHGATNEKEVIHRRNNLLNQQSDHLSLLKIINCFEYALKTKGKSKSK